MSWFRWLSWIPAAAWLGLRQVVGGYEGWGRWAAAPLLLLPVALSTLFVGAAALIVTRPGSRPVPTGDWIAIGVASLPLIWFAARLATA